MTLGSPWNFPCQFGTSDCDDVVRPFSNKNQTNVTWVSLVVPEQLSREIGNRWIGGVAYAEVPTERAIELLAHPVWRAINAAVADRLLPPKPEATPMPTPVPVSPEAQSEQEVTEDMIRDARELDRPVRPLVIRLKTQRVSAELLRDPKRTDYSVAASSGVSRSFAVKVRAALVEAGTIPAIALSERKPRPRAKRYTKWHERLQIVAAQTREWRRP